MTIMVVMALVSVSQAGFFDRFMAKEKSGAPEQFEKRTGKYGEDIFVDKNVNIGDSVKQIDLNKLREQFSSYKGGS